MAASYCLILWKHSGLAGTGVRSAAVLQGNDPADKSCVLGLHQLQFGLFRGQTFKWVMENCLGYGGYLVASMIRETGEVKDSRNHRANKEAFNEYMELFPEAREAISIKVQRSGAQPTITQESSSSASLLTAIPPVWEEPDSKDP